MSLLSQLGCSAGRVVVDSYSRDSLVRSEQYRFMSAQASKVDHDTLSIVLGRARVRGYVVFVFPDVTQITRVTISISGDISAGRAFPISSHAKEGECSVELDTPLGPYRLRGPGFARIIGWNKGTRRLRAVFESTESTIAQRDRIVSQRHSSSTRVAYEGRLVATIPR